jgi:hypothetical protein
MNGGSTGAPIACIIARSRAGIQHSRPIRAPGNTVLWSRSECSGNSHSTVFPLKLCVNLGGCFNGCFDDRGLNGPRQVHRFEVRPLDFGIWPGVVRKAIDEGRRVWRTDSRGVLVSIAQDVRDVARVDDVTSAFRSFTFSVCLLIAAGGRCAALGQRKQTVCLLGGWSPGGDGEESRQSAGEESRQSAI